MTCQAFSARLNDRRRRGTPLFQNRGHVCTGIDFRATMLRTGARVPAFRVTWPTVIPAEEAAPEAGEDAGEEGEAAADFAAAFGDHGSEEIAMLCKTQLGWNTSYRSSQPERKSFSSWRRRWTRQRLRYSGTPLLAPRVRRSQLEQLELQKSWQQRRRVSR